jgi:hypothetical protein
MNAKKPERTLKAELYEQYEELLFRIALLEINEDEADRLDQDHVPDPEMEKFFVRTQAGTLRIIDRASRKVKTRRAIKTGLPHVLQIAAAVLLVFFVGATVAIASVHEVRVRVLQFLIHIEEEYTELSLVESPDETFSVPEGWHGAYYPSYIPEGFVMQAIDPYFNRVYYLNGTDDLLDFMEFTENDYTNIDTEDAEIQHIVINGSAAILSEKDGEVTVSWATLDRYFVLTLDGEIDTALRIVKSVKIIK